SPGGPRAARARSTRSPPFRRQFRRRRSAYCRDPSFSGGAKQRGLDGPAFSCVPWLSVSVVGSKRDLRQERVGDRIVQATRLAAFPDHIAMTSSTVTRSANRKFIARRETSCRIGSSSPTASLTTNVL